MDSLRTYRAKRDFARSAEPDGSAPVAPSDRLRFVVQRHAASHLHYDLRLELDGVFASWAVAKGPSLDPADKRLAVQVEDHPLEYGDFEGTIPKGEYGGGTVQIWDRGTWAPEGMQAQAGIEAGELKFTLEGERLRGSWVLVRMKKWSGKRVNWLLIKHRDQYATEGGELEDRSVASGRPMAQIAQGTGRAPKPFMVAPAKPQKSAARSGKAAKARASEPAAPAAGAVRGSLPERQAPQLAQLADEPPEAAGWVSEIKFDGYRLLARIENGAARLLTRNGLDWTDRLPAVAAAMSRLGLSAGMVDGELVALGADGVSSFAGLQKALKAGQDDRLRFYAFDLLHLDGWDLRPCGLVSRKALLAGLDGWGGMLRISEHHEGQSGEMRRAACRMHLEGIVCKRSEAPYRAGRGSDWRKLKCSGREEFLVLGYTLPEGSRVGLGALQLGYRTADGALQFAGGVGTGFDARELRALRKTLDGMRAEVPDGLLASADPVARGIRWVRPELVAEVQFTGWSGGGRLRHAAYLGLREDKAPEEVVRALADPEAPRVGLVEGAGRGKRSRAAVPAVMKAGAVTAAAGSRIVRARAPGKRAETVLGVALTHPDRALWPGVSKRDLAGYWQAVAAAALPGIAARPLSILRCPDGIGGEHFFQKHGHGISKGMSGGTSGAIREGSADGQPYLAIDDAAGLVAMAQLSAIELHVWGAAEAAPDRPDRLVFDLDPGAGVAFGEVVRAALDLRQALGALGLESWCRTTGGKGLHVVAPLDGGADWAAAKAFCRGFAQGLAQAQPTRFVAHVKIADRAGRILIDWLRNGAGATAVASFSPRARDGAGVATPLAWREVGARLDPRAFTIATVPGRLRRLKRDPWEGFGGCVQGLPRTVPSSARGRTPA